MADREYELTFELPELSDELELELMDATDATISTSRGVTLATLVGAGVSALAAATNARLAVEALGIRVMRCVEDLVTPTSIAERLGVSRQAAGHWIRGQRQKDSEFPTPYVVAGGGLWLWGEVLEWARQNAPDLVDQYDQRLSFPTRHEHAAISGHIEAARVARAAGWSRFDERSVSVVVAAAQGSRPVSPGNKLRLINGGSAA